LLSNSDAAVKIEIEADMLDLHVSEQKSVGNSLDAMTADRAWGMLTPEEFGRDEDVDFVDHVGVEEAAEHSRAAFDKHIRHLAAA
jgi:hypothetical protein